jgi:starvation-inducible DNA-binding protein
VKLYSTRNDLPAAIRTKIIRLCNARLADGIDLQTQVKQAHWNVKGADFVALHRLFDEIDDDVEEYVDLTAERVVQLGGIAEGTARLAVAASKLPEYPLTAADGMQHVAALAMVLAAYGKGVRAAIDKADELGDKDTADIFTEISRGVDKWLWFVEAHLQSGSITAVQTRRRAPERR